MSALQLIYKFIYNKNINFISRNLNKFVSNLFPKIIQLPPSGILSLKTKSGTLKVATNQTNYITHLLFWNGYKQFEYSKVFEDLITDCSCFLDIGSNIGYYSLLAAKTNPEIKAYAFEPAIGPKYYLEKNIRINNFKDAIHLIDIALSNTIGQIDFYEVENSKYSYLKYNLAGEGNTGTKTTSRNFIKNKVQTTTLTDFVTKKNIQQIDLIKIDTEGTEIDILNSGKDVILQHSPIVICETLFNSIENELDTFFKSLDYQFYNHTPEGLTRVDSIKRKEDNGIRNCFFVPESKVHLIRNFVVN